MGLVERAAERHAAGQFAEAESAYRQILREEPDHPEALQLLGVLLAQGGRLAAGAELMQRSLALNPAQAGVHANLGNALIGLEQYADALRHLDRAQALAPDMPGAWINHGGALIVLGRLEEAVASCSQAVAVAPHSIVPILNRAKALEGLARYEAALADYGHAIRLQPDNAAAHARRGLLLLDINNPAEALPSLQSALTHGLRNAQVHHALGRALALLGRLADAAAALKALELIDPYHEGARGLRLHLQMCTFDWSGWNSTSTILEEIEAGRLASPPFALLALTDSPGLQLQCAELQRRCTELPASPPAVPHWTGPRHGHERLRIGYLSADLTEHAMAYLMAGVFEQHDRRRFETMAFALRKDEHSVTGRRVRAAFERVIDAAGLSDAAIAARVRAEEVDVLVDLMGHTGGCRAGVLAHRPAPVQVSYLGFPASIGRSIADYIVADEFVIPPERRGSYGESVVYLPDCFQANDDRRSAAAPSPSRAQVGLPAGAFVWCSFHSSYKINPPLFDVWARLLLATPGSVLWVYCDSDAALRNLQREALSRGLSPERIIAAPKASYGQHLARIGLADLCLDTWPFNGGTTTSDALWAGVPVVTYAGRSFASRMSGSLLRCAGLEDLVTGSLEDYERAALDAARDARRLQEFRMRLAANRGVNPLFDTARFCRHLEAAYAEMHARRQRGERPESFRVAREA